MTLEEFRAAKGWNYRELAEFLGHDQKVVRPWCLPFDDPGFKRPLDVTRISIREKTAGAVDLADWFPKSAAAKKAARG